MKIAIGNNGRSSGRARQASIISVASLLFAARGFSGTTTREIAKKAGISEALLFKYFPTKQKLYSAILTEKSELSQLMTTVEEAAAQADDARVFSLVAGFRINRRPDPILLRLLLYSALEGHELANKFFRSRQRIFYDFLAGYIARRSRQGAFRQVDPMLAARAFVGMVVYHRIVHEVFKVPMHCTPEDAVATYVKLFLGGLRIPREKSAMKLRRTKPAGL
jgi:AcrR family transcriptional regulator